VCRSCMVASERCQTAYRHTLPLLPVKIGFRDGLSTESTKAWASVPTNHCGIWL
jgi:hypothetical protein